MKYLELSYDFKLLPEFMGNVIFSIDLLLLAYLKFSYWLDNIAPSKATYHFKLKLLPEFIGNVVFGHRGFVKNQHVAAGSLG